MMFSILLLAALPPVVAPSPELAVMAAASNEAGTPKVTRATFIGMPQPAANVDFAATLLQSNASDRITVLVEGRVGGAPVARQIYELLLTKNGAFIVPTKTIAKGATITAADLESKSMDLGGPTGRFATDFELVVGRIAKATLLAGRPVPLAELDAPNAVARGDEVKVAIKTGGLEVTIVAEALDAGGIGERVRARNRTSQKLLSAVVVGPGRLEANNP